MMPLGSPVPFTSFTMLLHVEDVLQLQVPANRPDRVQYLCPFVSVDGQIMLLVLV